MLLSGALRVGSASAVSLTSKSSIRKIDEAPQFLLRVQWITVLESANSLKRINDDSLMVRTIERFYL